VVCSLLGRHCSSYVESEFTKVMEERLDLIAGGGLEPEEYLRGYYEGEGGLKATVARMQVSAPPPPHLFVLRALTHPRLRAGAN
jgi:DNA topoisomerase IA